MHRVLGILLFLAFWPVTLWAATDPFTIVVLPDTQLYAQKFPAVFHKQTEWIANNKEQLNIRFVTHLGDVVQDNQNVPAQWDVAAAAMARLDGVVPWGVVAGNHDLDLPLEAGQATAYLKHFGPQRFKGKPWFVSSSANGLDTAQTFTGGGRQYLFLHMAIDTPDESIAWASDVLKQYPGVPTLITTHVYLDRSGKARRTKPYCRGASGNSAQNLWDKFISKHPQIFFVMCGHWCAESTLTPKNDAGSVTYEMIVDYQNRPNGGNGWLQTLTFEPDKNQIRVKTYSPWLDKYETDADSDYTIPLNFTERFGRLKPAATTLLKTPTTAVTLNKCGK